MEGLLKTFGSNKAKNKAVALIALKFAIGAFAFAGTIMALCYAVRDGYNHWWNRLMFFTNQSNIWTGTISIILAVYLVAKNNKSTKILRTLYVFRYVFTISIVLTGVVFCGLLAPFAHRENYNAWTLSSIFTHIIVPALAVIDFILDDYKINYTKKHLLFTLIPPFVYTVFAIVLGILKVDFGRGDTFPYFFFNFNTPSGFFGASWENKELGSIYWIALLLICVLAGAFTLRAVSPYARAKRKERRAQRIKNI